MVVFFEFTHDCPRTYIENSSRISDTTAVNGHFGNLSFNFLSATLIAVVENKALMVTFCILTKISLFFFS